MEYMIVGIALIVSALAFPGQSTYVDPEVNYRDCPLDSEENEY